MKTKNRKVSFDFDSTLSRKDVQSFAKELISKGVDVWVCTSRFSDENLTHTNWDNSDLFNVAKELGVSKKKIIFTNMRDKWEMLKEQGFIFHLDDDSWELFLINKHTKTIGISVTNTSSWKVKCLRILKKCFKEEIINNMEEELEEFLNELENNEELVKLRKEYLELINNK